MYKFVGKKGQMYSWEAKLNESHADEPYVGECSQRDFSENVRRLMHKGDWPLEQVLAITFSECERGKAHKEGEGEENKK
jgi:hypothetical protein